ncbi:disease resistance protein At4g27190-like [Punica granatum]|nr:disease resistance protein At4g27190-like [Punica granatum]XP_031388933.1 disease resistance protein At4g27190-like [Punica granatum]
MLCQAEVGLRPLSDEEAWALFVQTLDGPDLPPSQKHVAEDIVKECKGLPLAIVVMAGSMRGEVEDHVWEATLENLKQPGVLQQSMKEDVFPILVQSYNRLEEKKQRCFSLCALYPEDWSIPRPELIELCIDEGVIREDRRRKMYNEGHRLLDELEKACLLEACGFGSSKAVRMHDVIRDMALHIMNANSAPWMVKGLGLEDVLDDSEWLPNLQKVSLMTNDIEAIPPSISPNCPQLATLLLSDCRRLHEISEQFFQRMQGLKVIALSKTSITKVPKSVGTLEKLNALILNGCSQLSCISFLAKLTSLRKLDLRGCTNINEVPDGLGMLVNLTYLRLSGTGIKRIPDGVVCKLKKLQHLEADYIAARAEEVVKLRKLEVLRCRFENVNELNEYTLHATTLESYILLIGDRTNDSALYDFWHGLFPSDSGLSNCGKVIFMNVVSDIRETCLLPRDVEALGIRECGRMWNISRFMGLEEVGGSGGQPEEPEGQLEERTSPPPPGDHFPSLKELEILYCPNLKRLLVPRHSCSSYLTQLEMLKIRGCHELESMTVKEESLTSSTSPLPPDAFSQLQSITISSCAKMKRVLTLELFMLLPNLQTIIVDYCEEMKEVIGGQELDHGATSSSFLSPMPAASPGDQLSTRKLTLVLDYLEELESICRWTGLRDLIHVIVISRCPKLKRIEMLDDASPPPSLKEIVLSEDVDRGKRWWESLEWVHPEAKTALEPYVFVDTLDRGRIPLRECPSEVDSSEVDSSEVDSPEVDSSEGEQ